MADESKNSKRDRQYEEINEYRDLLETPDQFEEGFTKKTIIGVFFIAFIMTPGQIYMGLYAGIGMGSAAQWVTVILFLEIAKRSFTTLRRQEIFLLTYVASQLIARADTGTFQQLIWRQYFVGSQEARQFGLTQKLVDLKFMGYGWFSPSPDSAAVIDRTFFHADWALPILLMVLSIIVGKITWFTSGYILFRLVSDREHLPFPTAPQAALAAMALAEESGSEEETWKWPCFTIGGAIGLVFGFIYVGIPTMTEVFAGTRVTILPIPFVDLTPVLGRFIGATPIAISFDLGPIFVGLLAPFWGIMGTFFAVISFMVISPILHTYGYMPHWLPGMSAVQTQIQAGVDFWQPFGMGVTLTITVISLWQVIRAGQQYKEDAEHAEKLGHDPRTCKHPDCQNPSQIRGYCVKHLNRGDFPLWVCIALFFLGASYPIIMAKTLFPVLVSTGMLLFILLIAFVYAPLMSFVSARLDGLIGRNIQIPHMHQATVFLTGFRGVEIWFIPLAGADFGGNAETFRIIELTGMRFTSLLKAELVMVPVVLGASLLYWGFLWKLAPIPSDAYPYVQTFWPPRAFSEAVQYSATQYSLMYRAGDDDAEDDRIVQPGEVVWSPANLQDGKLYYWRVRVTDQLNVRNPDKRVYSRWSDSGHFYTDFRDRGGERETPVQLTLRPDKKVATHLPEFVLLSPENGGVVNEPEILMEVRIPPEWDDPVGTLSNGTGMLAKVNDATYTVGDFTVDIDDTSLTGTVVAGDIFTVAGDAQQYVVTAGATASGNAIAGMAFTPASKVAWADDAVITFFDRLEFVFELDTDPTYRGDFYQGSVDIPMFFEIYWRDLTYTGDGLDDDLDGAVDEEVWNQKDDDGDGEVDEDTRQPLGGEKWPILVLGTVFSMVLYVGLNLFGMPMFFMWGYIGAVASVGVAGFFAMFTEVIGAFLAKYYFWPKYGKQQWRRYAMIIAVGYGVGVSLIGMACSALRMIEGAVSATTF